jgi:hypothetical protein
MRNAQIDYLKNNPHPFKGRKHSEESKLKMSISAIGRKFTKEQNKRKGRKGSTPPNLGLFGVKNPLSKSINQYSMTGYFLKKWDCGLDIKRSLGFNNSNISSCCKGRLKSSSGFIWKYNN